MPFNLKPMLAGLGLCATVLVPSAALALPLVDRPLVIAHRGASGYLPEHTLEAYRLAVEMGADFIEPDLFLTADGQLVARHDRNLNATTNAGAVNIDTVTLAQVKSFNAVSRGTTGYATPANSPYYDGTETFRVPTFNEVLDDVYDLHARTGKVVGVYPEVKTISGNAPYNRAIADTMVAALNDPKYGSFFDGHLGNVFLQSFDPSIVQYLNTVTDLPLVLLGACPSSAAAATAVRGFAVGVGVSQSLASQACIDRVHDAGLLIHVYTLTNSVSQYETFYGRGVDGIFANHPDVALSVRDTLFPPTAPIPEPATWALFALGLAGVSMRASKTRFRARG